MDSADGHDAHRAWVSSADRTLALGRIHVCMGLPRLRRDWGPAEYPGGWVALPITAAVLDRPGEPLRLAELRLDDPMPMEVRVSTRRVGLCHSDLHYIHGSLSIGLPAVLGHEVFGIVESVGVGVSRLAPGDRVVATVTPSCGGCASCLRGRPTQCLTVETTRHRIRPKITTGTGEPVEALGGIGGLANFFLASELSLAKVADDVPASVACLLGCCVTTGVGAAIHGAAVGPEHSVLVIGCGGVGVAAIQGARLAGAQRIVAVDTSPQKLDIARGFGASDVVLGGNTEETLRDLRALVPHGFDHAIEAVGQPTTAELAFAALAPTGTATILGLMREGSRLSIPADALVYGDRVLQGAYMGANRFLSDVEMFRAHYLAGRLDLDHMVTRELPFQSVNEGFAAMADPGTVRVVLTLEEGSSWVA